MCTKITVFGTCHDVQDMEKWPGRKLSDTVYKRLLTFSLRKLRGWDRLQPSVWPRIASGPDTMPYQEMCRRPHAQAT